VLSEAERRLLLAVPTGAPAICGPSADDNDPANDPTKAAKWSADRELRAELIRWLCVDLEVAKRVDPRGIQVHGAKVIGEMDLSFATIAFPLVFGAAKSSTIFTWCMLRFPR